MRSLGSTYLELDFSVTSLTKEMIAFFEAPSFHDGSGSSKPAAPRAKAPKTVNAADVLIKSRRVIFMRPLVCATLAHSVSKISSECREKQITIAVILSQTRSSNSRVCGEGGPCGPPFFTC